MVFSTYPLGITLPKILHLCILMLILHVNNSTMTKFDAISSKESPILASLQNMEVSLQHRLSFFRFRRLCYRGKEQKSFEKFKELAIPCSTKREICLEALLACIRGRLGCEYISLTM